MSFARLVKGDTFSDQRGALRFFNDLDMREIVRFYEISPSDTKIIRAWQGHKKEKKWFYCSTGAFIIQLIKIDSFEEPSDQLETERVILRADHPTILLVSEGFATGIKSLEPGSKLQVFSNFTVEQSKQDDYRFPPEKWKVKW